MGGRLRGGRGRRFGGYGYGILHDSRESVAGFHAAVTPFVVFVSWALASAASATVPSGELIRCPDWRRLAPPLELTAALDAPKPATTSPRRSQSPPGDRRRSVAATVPGDECSRHTVRAGETLSAIAAARLGSARRWPEIAAANRAVAGDPKRLPVGAEMVMPCGPGGTATPTPATAAKRADTPEKAARIAADTRKALGQTGAAPADGPKTAEKPTARKGPSLGRHGDGDETKGCRRKTKGGGGSRTETRDRTRAKAETARAGLDRRKGRMALRCAQALGKTGRMDGAGR